MNLTLAVSLQLPLLPQVTEKWIYLGPSRMLWLSSTSMTTTSEARIPFDSAPGSTFTALSSASIVLSQHIEDPFGETPFKAIPSAENNQPPQDFSSTTNAVAQSSETFQPASPQIQLTLSGFDFGDTFESLSFGPSECFQIYSYKS
ncbi:uncharacterized protein LOC113283739 [Papaver somniferum]|uniref:uncharacterized protein LOC113283739 n=1 Tax=Papaver somniferum TaxID=3469 RepID=UPI000E6F8EE3|nr:uncharacterized protein LOC113283739 [Papaver somniferum]XP_026388877.1 uncharacterized protein LOC113283739 [Papaver somniferum]